MSIESRVEAQLNLALSGAKTLEEARASIIVEFYGFLEAIKKKQLKALDDFTKDFEEKEGITPEALDFKAIVELIKYYRIRDFNLVDNCNSTLEEFLKA